MSALPLQFDIGLEVLGRVIKQEKEIKDTQPFGQNCHLVICQNNQHRGKEERTYSRFFRKRSVDPLAMYMLLHKKGDIIKGMGTVLKRNAPTDVIMAKQEESTMSPELF